MNLNINVKIFVFASGLCPQIPALNYCILPGYGNKTAAYADSITKNSDFTSRRTTMKIKIMVPSRGDLPDAFPGPLFPGLSALFSINLFLGYLAESESLMRVSVIFSGAFRTSGNFSTLTELLSSPNACSSERLSFFRIK
jgi:hypothetical protein